MRAEASSKLATMVEFSLLAREGEGEGDVMLAPTLTTLYKSNLASGDTGRACTV